MKQLSQKQHDWLNFLSLCEKIAKKGDLVEFFDIFLTYEEKQAIANRYLIVHGLLKADKPQRELAASLEVSIAKITRGSNQLKQVEPDFKQRLLKIMDKLENE